MTASINGTTGVTFPDASTQNTAATGFGFKSRIINGAMMIDQRNSTVSTANTTSVVYRSDRWAVYGSVAGKFDSVHGSLAGFAPAGFTDYFGISSNSTYTVGAAEIFLLRQPIEGVNVSDFAWGTSSAKSITVSFWVNCSLTGTFGGAIQNESQNYNYPFSYTVSSANTWEYKTITIPGATSGAWNIYTGTGLYLSFSLGTGATYSATAGAWTATANIYAPTGSTSVVGTSGATFYITGVQLEKGSTATSFDYRPYGTELELCQRYFEKSYEQSVVPATPNSPYGYVSGKVASTTVASTENYGQTYFAVVKRSQPTVTVYGYGGGSTKVANYAGIDQASNSGVVNAAGGSGFSVYNNTGGTFTTTGNVVIYHWTATAEL